MGRPALFRQSDADRYRLPVAAFLRVPPVRIVHPLYTCPAGITPWHTSAARRYSVYATDRTCTRPRS